MTATKKNKDAFLVNQGLLTYGESDEFKTRVIFLAQQLDLIGSRDLCGTQFSEQLQQRFSNNPDEFLNAVSLECNEKLEIFTNLLLHQLCLIKHSRWFIHNKFSLSKIEKDLKQLATTSVVALLDLYCSVFLAPSGTTLISHLIEWFIKYAPVESILENDIVNELGQQYYKEYIARLPKEDLAEYLLSDRKNLRVMANNKIKLEQE